MPYLKIHTLNFYKGSFQLHHKSFTHATVLWRNIKVREPWPHPPGEGESCPLGWRRPESHGRNLGLHLSHQAPHGLSFLQLLEGSEDALRLLPGAAFLSLMRGYRPWSNQWQLGHHPHPDRIRVSGVCRLKQAQHLRSWQCGCQLLEDTKR